MACILAKHFPMKILPKVGSTRIVHLFIIVLLVPMVSCGSDEEIRIFDKDFGMVKLADNSSLAEGPAISPDGELYFSDHPGNKISKIDKEGLDFQCCEARKCECRQDSENRNHDHQLDERKTFLCLVHVAISCKSLPV